VAEVCGFAIREAERVCPHQGDAEIYSRGYEVYQSLYPALKPVFGRIAEL
jgi:hypothetical protein